MTMREPQINDALTPKESVVLERIVDGETDKEIARVLGISHRTVEVHRARIRTKLGARRSADIVRIAMARKVSAP